MAKKTALFRVLFAAIVVVCYSSVPLFANASGEQRAKRQWYFVNPGTDNAPGHTVLHKNYSVQSSHIKVRYLGGDGSYSQEPCVPIRGGVYTNVVVFCGTREFVYVSSNGLFQLRGPPGRIIMCRETEF